MKMHRWTGGIEPLESRIALTGDLVVQSVVTKLPDIMVPGDGGIVSFVIKNVGTNAGADDIDGKTGLRVYLSSNGVLDGNDILVGRIPDCGCDNAPVKLKAGQSKTIISHFSIPPLQLPSPDPRLPEGNYFILVQVDTPGKITEGNESNNVGVSTSSTPLAWEFGDVGSRKGVELSTSGGTFGMKGGGTGGLTAAGGFVDVGFLGTTDKTSAVLKRTETGQLDIRNIVAAGPLKKLDFARVDVGGAVNLLGGANTVLFGDVDPGLGFAPTITIAGTTAPDLIFGRVRDANLTVPGGIETLTVVDWSNVDVGVDTISADFLTKLTTTGRTKDAVDGDFAAGLLLDGTKPDGKTLGKALIKGTLHDTLWRTLGAGHIVGEIIAGSMENWQLDASDLVVKVQSNGDLTGNKASFTLRAHYFGQITALGTLDAKIVAAFASSKKVSIESIGAPSFASTIIDAQGGGIYSLKTEQWLGGGLKTHWVQTLEVKAGSGTSGDMAAAVNIDGAPIIAVGPLEVRDAPSKIKAAITKATISGALKAAGDWTISDHILALTAGSAEAGWRLTGTTFGDITRLGKIAFDGLLAGEIVAAGLDTLSANGFTGKITITTANTGDPDPEIKSLFLGAVQDTGVNSAEIITDARISKLTASNWIGGSNSQIEARALGKVLITGSKTLAGNLTDVSIRTTGLAPQGPKDFHLESLAVVGSMAEVGIIAENGGRVKFIEADEWLGGALSAGFLGKLTATGDKRLNVRGDLSGLTVNLRDFGGIGVLGIMTDTDLMATGSGIGIGLGGIEGSTINVLGNLDGFGIRNNLEANQRPARLFDNSLVTVGGILGEAAVRDVSTADAGIRGIVADRVRIYQRFEGNVKVFEDTGFDAPETFDTDGTFVARTT